MTYEYVAFTDGAARGRNGQGPAASAFVVYDGKGNKWEDGKVIGVATNNVAEYRALLRLLTWCVGQEVKSLHIKSDSQLMVRQVMGRYVCNHPDLQPLLLKALGMLEVIGDWRIEWIPRQLNKTADALCNQALDTA